MDKLLNTNYLRVMLANFCTSFSFYLLTPLLPLYLRDHFSASKDLIGLALSGYTITALLIRPFSGFILDSFDRKRFLLLSLLCYFIMFSGYLLAGSLIAFAIVRSAHGLPFGSVTVANNTMAIDVVSSKYRNQAIGYYGISNNIATAIAPTVGIVIYNRTSDFQILFVIALVVSLIGLISDSLIKIDSKPTITGKQKISLDRFFFIPGWLIALNMVLLGLCFGCLSNYLTIYSRESLGITSGSGTFFLVLSFGLILSRVIGARALKDGRLIRNCTEGLILSSFGYIIFVSVSNSIGYYLSAALIGLGNGHIWPAMQNIIISLAPNNRRGTAMSTILIAWDLGVGLGVITGGVVAEHYNYFSAFMMISIIHLLALCMFIFFTKRSCTNV